MMKLTNTISLLLGIVLICQPVEMRPEFQRLLNRLLRANTAITAIEMSTDSQILIFNDLESPTPTFADVTEAIDALDNMLVLLSNGQRHLRQVNRTTQRHMDRILAASSSAVPYESNTDLVAALEEARIKGPEFIGKVKEMAMKADGRFEENQFDINLKITNILDAVDNPDPSVLSSALTEAQDELNEAISDAISQMGEVSKAANEAYTKLQVDVFDKIILILIQMSDPQPPFNRFLLRFINA